MKVIRCDICGKETTKYMQVKYRQISNGDCSNPTHYDICLECFSAYIEDTSKVSKKCHIADMVKTSDIS